MTFGASTTNGFGSTVNANERYPDDLARRLRALPAGERLSVLNAGISGNHLLGSSGNAGPSALARTPQGEQVREAVNTWIMTSGAFDGILDFDAVLRDPLDPAGLLPAYDSGDHLYLSNAGYQAVTNAVSPQLLEGGSSSPG